MHIHVAINPNYFTYKESKKSVNSGFWCRIVLFLCKICFSMALLVSTVQRMFITLEYTKKKGPRVFKEQFSIKITPELKIANFLITIL